LNVSILMFELQIYMLYFKYYDCINSDELVNSDQNDNHEGTTNVFQNRFNCTKDLQVQGILV